MSNIVRRNKKGKHSSGSYKLLTRIRTGSKTTPENIELGLQTTDLHEALKRAKLIDSVIEKLGMRHSPRFRVLVSDIEGDSMIVEIKNNLANENKLDL